MVAQSTVIWRPVTRLPHPRRSSLWTFLDFVDTWVYILSVVSSFHTSCLESRSRRWRCPLNRGNFSLRILSRHYVPQQFAQERALDRDGVRTLG
jgi:hypothetical protein